MLVYYDVRYCFNSRTREGCDFLEGLTLHPKPSFNSRTREGCDSLWIEPEQQGQVSIHAPGRGATDSHIMSIVASFTFQFTHPGGVRHLQNQLISSQVQFQFTHPGGVRLHRVQTSVHQCKFQFTHPGGVRLPY